MESLAWLCLAMVAVLGSGAPLGTDLVCAKGACECRRSTDGYKVVAVCRVRLDRFREADFRGFTAVFLTQKRGSLFWLGGCSGPVGRFRLLDCSRHEKRRGCGVCTKSRRTPSSWGFDKLALWSPEKVEKLTTPDPMPTSTPPSSTSTAPPTTTVSEPPTVAPVTRGTERPVLRPLEPVPVVPVTPPEPAQPLLTTAKPTAPPTSPEPTTAEPTSPESTTAEPTTAEPTTAEPTTAEPTTAAPIAPTVLPASSSTSPRPTSTTSATSPPTISPLVKEVDVSKAVPDVAESTTMAVTQVAKSTPTGLGEGLAGGGFFVLMAVLVAIKAIRKYGCCRRTRRFAEPLSQVVHWTPNRRPTPSVSMPNLPVAMADLTGFLAGPPMPVAEERRLAQARAAERRRLEMEVERMVVGGSFDPAALMAIPP